MKVLMVLSDNTYPPDIRVTKEIKTLMKNGYEISLLARSGQNQKDREILDGVDIYRYNLIPSFLGTLYYFTLSRFTVGIKVLKIARDKDIDIIHVHDLPLALSSLVISKILKIPIVVDLHENYPILVLNSAGAIKRSLATLLSFILKIEERIVIQYADKVLTISELEVSRIKHITHDTNKIYLVPNTVDFSEIKNVKKIPRTDTLKDKFVISYVGGLSLHRGIETLLEALKLSLSEADDIHVLIVGDGPHKKALVDKAYSLNVQNYVTFTGWVNFEEAMGHIINSDLCIIPYISNLETEIAIPHKFFQYLYFEKPVITSNVTSLKKLIDEIECGCVFDAGDSVDLSRRILWLKDRPYLLKEYGKNGKKAVIEKYNWDFTSRELVAAYISIGSVS